MESPQPRRVDLSQPPLPVECCAKCRFFFPLNPQTLLCRRFPPVMTLLVIPAALPRGLLQRDPTAQAPMTFINQSVYATVAPDLWCGEFKPEILPP